MSCKHHAMIPSLQLLAFHWRLVLIACYIAATIPNAVHAFNGNNIVVHNQRINSLIGHQASDSGTNTDYDNSNDSNGTTHSIKAGFIGCGTIASAIATSLATPDHEPHLAHKGLVLSSISVTRRSERKSAALKEQFPEVVTVYDSAEEVAQNSDIVFLCVLPTQMDEVLQDLTDKGIWRTEEHTLVSLVATSKVDDMIRVTGLPPNSVYKVICLPPIAKRQGCALLQPPASESHPYLKPLLDALGGCVECADNDMVNAMMIAPCLMGPMYGVMRNTRDWLVKHGVSQEDASYFVGRSYLSMVQDAESDCRNPHRFDDLIEEQTPGGLNEQALGNLQKQGVFDAYDRTMDAIFSRLQGESDGSLPSDS